MSRNNISRGACMGARDRRLAASEERVARLAVPHAGRAALRRLSDWELVVAARELAGELAAGGEGAEAWELRRAAARLAVARVVPRPAAAPANDRPAAPAVAPVSAGDVVGLPSAPEPSPAPAAETVAVGDLDLPDGSEPVRCPECGAYAPERPGRGAWWCRYCLARGGPAPTSAGPRPTVGNIIVRGTAP